jgi:GAF domain-containing protein
MVNNDQALPVSTTLSAPLSTSELSIEESRRQIARLRLASDQILQTWELTDPDIVLEQTLISVLKQINEEVILAEDYSAAVHTYKERSNQFEVGAAYGGDLADYMRVTPPRPDGTTAFVMKQRESLFVTDIDAMLHDLPGASATARAAGLRAFANIPLLMGVGEREQVIGVLNINLKSRFEFSAEHRARLELMAQQAAVALQVARYHRRRVNEEIALRSVSASAAEVGLVEAGNVITEYATELSHASYASLWAIDDRREKLYLIGFYNDNAEWKLPHNELPLDDSSMNGDVFLSRKSRYEFGLDQRGAKNYARWRPEIRAAYCVPLEARGELVGTLYVAAERERGISKPHQRFVDELAKHAAIALHDARNQAQLKAITDFQSIISDVLPIEAQIEQIHEELGKRLDAKALFVARIDPETRRITLPIVYDKGEQVSEDLKKEDAKYGPRDYVGDRPNGFLDHMIRTEKPLLISDVENWSEKQQVADTYRQEVKSFVAVLIRVRDRVVGALGMRNFERADAYDTRHLSFLEAVANPIGIALENAYQFDAIIDFQRDISEIATMDEQLERIYRAMVKTMQPLMNTRNMYIALFDEASRLVSFPLVYENGQEVASYKKGVGEPYGSRLFKQDSGGLTDWVIRHRKVLLVPDAFEAWVLQQDDIQAFAMGTKCWLGAPMIFGGAVIGAIGLQSFEQESVYEERHRRLLETIAGQAAIAIVNARQLERRTNELKAISRFQQAVTSLE